MKRQIGHGDVRLHPVSQIPQSAQRVSPKEGEGYVLMKGEVTGHAHRIQDTEAVELFQDEDGTLYVSAKRSTELTHEEHNPVQLNKGETFRVGPTYEYDPLEKITDEVRD